VEVASVVADTPAAGSVAAGSVAAEEVGSVAAEQAVTGDAAVPAAAAEHRLLTERQQRRIGRAVDIAERMSGLDFCVYVGPSEGDPRAYAEHLFEQTGLTERPGILLLVAPEHRRVEVLTAAEVRDRVTDYDCKLAVMAMTSSFALGDIVGGVCDGVRRLADAAGRGTAPAGAPDFPDLLTS
jgi:uncharacterized membrane protein YgcG